MLGPVSHIVFAFLALGNFSNNKWEQKDFIRGTSFSDIRYLGVIEREKTHLNDVTWEQIKKEKSSFRAGFLFHSLIDKLYDEFMIKNDVFSKLPKIPEGEIFFKLYGDMVLYEKISKTDWSKVLDFLSGPIIFEEKSFNLNEESINKWYDLLANYCKQKPSSKTIEEHILSIFKLEDPFEILKSVMNIEIHKIIDDIIEKFVANQELNNFVFNFYNFVEEKIKKPLWV